MKIVWTSNIDFGTYNLTKDICSGEWNYLLNDLIDAYAAYRGWNEEDYWYDDNDKLYEAECEAYEVIGELREEYN